MRVVVLHSGQRQGKPAREPARPKLAPDGAPVSELMMPQLTWPLVYVELVHCPGTFVRIEERRFDPARHRRATPKPRRQGAVKRERPATSTASRDELLTYTIGALLKLPEAAFIVTPAEDKATLVQQILKVRERA